MLVGQDFVAVRWKWTRGVGLTAEEGGKDRNRGSRGRKGGPRNGRG